MSLVNKRVLVTGGAGFIGSNLVRLLLSKNCKVRVVDSFVRGSFNNLKDIQRNPNIEILDYDLTKPEFAKEAAKDIQIVFDLAASVFGVSHLFQKAGSLLSNNVRISLNVAEACAALGIEHLIYTSSSCVYDFPNAKVPHKENDKGIPCTFYGWSKLIGEVICSAYNEESELRYSVARIFNAYGPRESLKYPHVIPEFILKAFACKQGSKDFEIIGDGLQTRSFLYIDDLLKGLIKLAEHEPLKGVVNIGSQEEITMIHLARMIIELVGLNSQNINFVHKTAHPKDIRKRSADYHKAYILLGWEPEIPLRNGLETTIRYMNKSQDHTESFSMLDRNGDDIYAESISL